VQIKLCDITGYGHFIDIAGQGSNDNDEMNQHIIKRLSSPEFWYMDYTTAKEYDCL